MRIMPQHILNMYRIILIRYICLNIDILSATGMQGKKWNDYLKAETILILIINFKNIKFIYLIVKIELSLSVIKVIPPLPSSSPPPARRVYKVWMSWMKLSRESRKRDGRGKGAQKSKKKKSIFFYQNILQGKRKLRRNTKFENLPYFSYKWRSKLLFREFWSLNYHLLEAFSASINS